MKNLVAFISVATTCCVSTASALSIVGSGFHNDHYYEVVEDKKTYEQAKTIAALRENCESIGYLAAIGSKEENDFILSIADGNHVFIGFDDIENEGSFQWLSGEPTSFEAWAHGEPNDYGSGEDCGRMDSDGQWHDVKCTTKNSFVIEYNCYDGRRLADSLTPAETGDFDGHYYEYFSDAKNYADATAIAEGRTHCGVGGYLVAINSPAENDFVKTLTGGSNPVLGASDIAAEGIFAWQNGEEFTYTNWNNNEPNNYGSGEDCVEMKSNGRWNDIDCSDSLPYIVEYTCNQAPTWTPPGEVADKSGDLDGHHYEFFNVKKQFDAAKAFASGKTHCGATGYLATVTSAAENDFILSLVGGNTPFLGGHDIGDEGTFVWDNGEPWIYDNWRPNEPNDYGSGEDCIEMHSSGGWNDQPCTRDRTIIVEYDCFDRPTASPTRTPEPTVSPTQRPADATAEYNNHYYEYFSMKMTYEDAQIFASKREHCGQTGYVVVVTNPDENQLVLDMVGSNAPFLGGSDKAVEGTFAWANGESFEYENWRPGEPNNYGSGEDCIEMHSSGGWNDQMCSKEKSVVVEYDCGQAEVWIQPATSSAMFQNHFYEFFNIPKSYEAAKTFAANRQYCGHTGYLVSVGNPDENAFVVDLASNTKTFLGLDDIEEEGTFQWADGTDLSLYDNWAPGEPNDYGDGEDCAHILSNTRWNDDKCSKSFAFMVEYDCGVAPIWAPPEETPIDSGYWGNHYYEVYNKYMTYDQAKAFAATKQFCGKTGYLVSIASEAENSFLMSKITGLSPWIGLDDKGTEGIFTWVNGDDILFKGWAPGEPNDHGTGEDCATMRDSSSGKWNDLRCDRTNAFIVEYDCGLAPAAPLVCDGPSALVWGDPHVVTYDKLKYDCQGEGEFVMARSLDSHFELQGRFGNGAGHSLGGSDYPVKVTRAVAFNTGEDGVPTIQVEVPEDIDAETCDFTFYVDKQPADILTDGIGYSDKIVVSETSRGRYGPTVIFRYPETGTRIEVSARHSKKNGCIMATQVCLPTGRFGTERIVGLMGSPNGEKNDDWMDIHGNPLALSDDRLFEDAYNYCVQNWCLAQASESLFYYAPGKSFADYNKCDNMYEDNGLQDAIAELSQEILHICDSDFQCLVDAAVGGVEDAQAAVDVQEQMEDIRLAPPPGETGVTAPVNAGYWGNHYYEIYGQEMTYDEATVFASSQTFCGEKGYLAVVNQEGENNYLASKLSGTKPWIGFDDKKKEGEFAWQNEDEITFLGWARGEPNDYGSGEDCTQMGHGSSGFWNDLKCDRKVGFIVEYDCGLAPPAPPRPLVCTGPTALVWGDPHVVTYDKLRYDCQGEGEFVLARSLDSNFEVQGRFGHGAGNSLGDDNYPVKVTRAIVWNTGEPGSPTIQVSVPDAPTDNVCEMEYHVNKQPRDILIDGIGFDEHVLVSWGGYQRYGETLVFYYPNYGTRIEVSARTSNQQGCVIAAQICLPNSRFGEEQIIGLFGTPDEDKTNDWMKTDGKTLPIGNDKRFQEAYDYCVNNWCLQNEQDSMFVYPPGEDFYTIKKCQAAYDSSLEDAIHNAPPAIVAACNGNAECVMDGAAGGTGINGEEEAQIALETETGLQEIRLAPPPGITLENVVVTVSEVPSAMPSARPSAAPSPMPSARPSAAPSPRPTPSPTAVPEIDTYYCDCEDYFVSTPSGSWTPLTEVVNVNGGTKVHLRRTTDNASGVTSKDAVVVEIGADLLEVAGSSLYINGQLESAPTLVAGYPVTMETVGSKFTYTVDFGNGEKLVLSSVVGRTVNMVRVLLS